jgi:hypothetical protein
MALSNDDIQKIIAMGGVKQNLKTGLYNPAIWNKGTNADNSNWLNSNKNEISNLIQQYPDVLRPLSENTQGESNVFAGLNTPTGAALVLAAMLAPAIAPSLMAEFGGAAVGSELAALEADAAIQAGLGASAGVAGADAVMPGALASEVAGEGTAQLGAGTSLSADAASNPLNPYYSTANPTVQANTGTVSNLVGGGAESNLATLDSLSNPLLPTSGAGIGGSELGATGSIIGSGQGLGVQTLPETLAPTGLNGLTVNDLNSQPLLNNGTSSSITGKDVADALRAANNANNLIKGLTSSQQKLASNQQNLQQSQALGNLLKANQFTPIATPEVYKAQNPFTFGQQEPIQGNPLASLLRNNYG